MEFTLKIKKNFLAKEEEITRKIENNVLQNSGEISLFLQKAGKFCSEKGEEFTTKIEKIRLKMVNLLRKEGQGFPAKMQNFPKRK